VNCGAGDQREFAELADRGTIAQDRIILSLDGVENLLSTTTKKIQVDGKLPAYFTDQRQALLEPLAPTCNFETHHLTKLGRVVAAGDVGLFDSIFPKIFEGKIYPAFVIVDADVLPEIRELQRGAGEIGKLLAFRITISAEIKDEMTDRIGGVAAVSEQVVEGFVPCDRLVLAEGGEQIGELMPGNVEFADGAGEGNENGMARIAVVAGVEFGFPLIEQLQGGCGASSFVAKIVGYPAVGVNVKKVLAEAFGQEPSGNGKIFVMGAGQAFAVRVRLG